MTDDRIKAVFEEYGRIVTGKEYALIHAIAEAVSPQRTWVGLTDEEVNKLVDDEDWYNDPHEFSRIVEAKVRGKNDAS